MRTNSATANGVDALGQTARHSFRIPATSFDPVGGDQMYVGAPSICRGRAVTPLGFLKLYQELG